MKKKPRCPLCGERVEWALNLSNMPVPFDATPTEKGDHAIIKGRCIHVDSKAADHYDGPRFFQHAQTCDKKPKE